MQEHGQALLGVLVGAALVFMATMMLTVGSCKVSYSHFNTLDNTYKNTGPPPSQAAVVEALEDWGLEIDKASDDKVITDWSVFTRTLGYYTKLEIQVRYIVDLQPKRRIQAQCISRKMGGEFKFTKCKDGAVLEYVVNGVRQLEQLPGFGD